MERIYTSFLATATWLGTAGAWLLEQGPAKLSAFVGILAGIEMWRYWRAKRKKAERDGGDAC